MVFYFSGTGNTRWVARLLAEATNERLINMAEAMDSPESAHCEVLQTHERIGIAFPVHSWGMPPIVESFIDRLVLDNFDGNFVYMVCTCGDDIGQTATALSRKLEKRGWQLNSAYSLQMPNTYVCLPGFDVDRDELRDDKLSKAKIRMKEICDEIYQRKTGQSNIVKGKWAWAKSHVIRPAFQRMLKNKGDKPFHITPACSGCGLCEKVCPVRNIDFSQAHPQWLGNCTNCLACYHICPVHAIRYGHQTDNKGQYWHDKYQK
jgi:formate hydrogenlyase subunit 6/NADH:ubiquinone oxidoreductase subunit I/flavodoxin